MYSIATTDQNEIENIHHLLKENKLPHNDIGPHVEFYLIKSKAVTAGVVGVEIYTPYALLRSLAIADPYKKKGLGKRLTVFMLDYLAVIGIIDVFLLTTTAAKFFEKIGFKKIDRKSVPEDILQTKEFSEICPDSAVCMQYTIY